MNKYIIISNKVIADGLYLGKIIIIIIIIIIYEA